jgi:altronate dehydratase large subunit
MNSKNLSFLGYERPDGTAGIRNHVLILPAGADANEIVYRIANDVNRTRFIRVGEEYSRPHLERETIGRLLIGLGKNTNVAAVIVVSAHQHELEYEELRGDRLAEEIAKTGKPVELINGYTEKGTRNTVAKGFEIARKLVKESSKIRRKPCDVKQLTIGIKCGMSDPTSGIAGNPSLGAAMDILVDLGGTVIFNESTEWIGAEEALVERAVNKGVAQEILNIVNFIEERAKSYGEDIRSTNPNPSNRAAGITTLEEKSLGAIAKGGTRTIMGLLNYAEKPHSNGLYLMDGWSPTYSNMLSLAAAGANLCIFQLGGEVYGPIDPPVNVINASIVSPNMFTTGNPRTYQKAHSFVDSNAGADFFEGKITLSEAGEIIFKKIMDIASGEMTKLETINYVDPVEVYLPRYI